LRSEAQRSGGEKIIEKVPHVAVAVLSEVGAAAWADVSRGEKKKCYLDVRQTRLHWIISKM